MQPQHACSSQKGVIQFRSGGECCGGGCADHQSRVAAAILSGDLIQNDGLVATVDEYSKHIFVFTGVPVDDWPEEIEHMSSPEFIAAFWQSLKEARKMSPHLRVKVTAVEKAPLTTQGVDVLVFPDCIRYIGLTVPDVPLLVSDITRVTISLKLRTEPAQGKYIFICSHNQRDRRCGTMGPLIANRFDEEVKRRHLGQHVTVLRSSHVGGHKYAGNVLVFPPGDWYGYVRVENVSQLLDEAVIAGRVVADKWRGRMGLSLAQMRRYGESSCEGLLAPEALMPLTMLPAAPQAQASSKPLTRAVEALVAGNAESGFPSTAVLAAVGVAMLTAAVVGWRASLQPPTPPNDSLL